MADQPTIIGSIDMWTVDGRAGLSLHKYGHEWGRGPATLYAWSDGVITWTADRTF